MQLHRLAAIDLGTNSARLAVVGVESDGALRVIVDERVPCRLGQDLAHTGRLHPDAEARALQALRTLAGVAASAGASRTCVVGTYALRRAANGAAFVARVRRELGLELRILTGEEEAQLVLRAASLHAAVPAAQVVCLDLGGGSLELARAGDGAPILVSLPLGAVVMSGGLEAPTALASITRLRARTATLLHVGASAFAGASREPIAAGGTITSAARMVAAGEALPATRLEIAALEALTVRVAALDLEARRRLPGLPADRADIIVAGLAVLCETLVFLGASALRVHEQGIREGVLLAMQLGEM